LTNRNLLFRISPTTQKSNPDGSLTRELETGNLNLFGEIKMTLKTRKTWKERRGLVSQIAEENIGMKNKKGGLMNRRQRRYEAKIFIKEMKN
jgi:hypothetical protein